MSGKKSGMKKVIESTNLEKQLTRHHEGDSDYTHQGTGSSKKVLIAAVCLTLGYAVIEVIGGFLSNSLASRFQHQNSKTGALSPRQF